MDAYRVSIKRAVESISKYLIKQSSDKHIYIYYQYYRLHMYLCSDEACYSA
jgi:hypothetical protein